MYSVLEIITEWEQNSDPTRTLDFFGMYLRKLPHLPTHVQSLNCRENCLKKLANPLPAGLVNLFCAGNRLSCLPSLPIHLKILFCSNNRLVSLPPLPFGLNSLYCWNNRLRTLGPLPDTLITLHCWGNDLLIIPDTWPKNLVSCVLSNADHKHTWQHSWRCMVFKKHASARAQCVLALKNQGTLKMTFRICTILSFV